MKWKIWKSNKNQQIKKLKTKNKQKNYIFVKKRNGKSGKVTKNNKLKLENKKLNKKSLKKLQK